MTGTTIDNKIVIMGLGYLGPPLAVEFGKKYDTVWLDINKKRVEKPRKGIDRTLETSAEDIRTADGLRVTTEIEAIRPCKLYTHAFDKLNQCFLPRQRVIFVVEARKERARSGALPKRNSSSKSGTGPIPEGTDSRIPSRRPPYSR